MSGGRKQVPVVVCKHKHVSKWEESGDVFLMVHCAGVLGAASHAGPFCIWTKYRG